MKWREFVFAVVGMTGGLSGAALASKQWPEFWGLLALNVLATGIGLLERSKT